MTTARRKGQHRREPIGMPTAAQKAGAVAASKKVADATWSSLPTRR